jgi:predicted XRE-type DNA-binding protein
LAFSATSPPAEPVATVLASVDPICMVAQPVNCTEMTATIVVALTVELKHLAFIRIPLDVRQNFLDFLQQQAAAAMGLPQSQLSDLLRGRFRGTSETQLLDGRAQLDGDVEIVVVPRCRRRTHRRVLSRHPLKSILGSLGCFIPQAWPTARLAARVRSASWNRLRWSSAGAATVKPAAGEAGGLPRRRARRCRRYSPTPLARP